MRGKITLSQKSHSWTRFPFRALLTRPVRVYKISSESSETLNEDRCLCGGLREVRLGPIIDPVSIDA